MTKAFNNNSVFIQGYSSLRMILLKKVHHTRRLVHSSSHPHFWSYPVLKDKRPNETSENTSNLNKSDEPAADLECEMSLPASERKGRSNEPTLPEEPTTCCMSGCANCVWVEYANQLSKLLKDGEKAKELVLSKVTDPNMRAFLLLELKNLKNSNGTEDKTS